MRAAAEAALALQRRLWAAAWPHALLEDAGARGSPGVCAKWVGGGISLPGWDAMHIACNFPGGRIAALMSP